jgi:glycosyltransferase involved in cell wall biosynthesis
MPMISDNSMPLLTVIIPTYNRATLLAETLESLRTQEFTDFEAIVVDDGSTDDTPAVLARFGEGEPPGRFRVLRQLNAGQGAARNLAIAEARGEYCSFLDDDDLFFPWTLGIVAEAIRAAGQPSVLLGKEQPFENLQAFSGIPRNPLRISNWPDLYKYAGQHSLGPCGVLVARTALLREVGGFLCDRIVGEDADLMLRLGVAPKMVKIESPSMYGYRMHAENFTRTHWASFHRGAGRLLERYRGGVFPGGISRKAEVRKQVANAAAYYSAFCLFYGGRRACMEIYFRTMGLQALAGNFGFIFNTPIDMVRSLFNRHYWIRPGRRGSGAANQG